MKADLYDRITKQILEKLEEGVLPWLQPWSAAHAAGRTTRPLRANGIAYQGINVLTLWMAASASGYAAPIWMTFKQARDLGATVRRGEHGSPVVYADTLTRTKTDEKTGEETAHANPLHEGLHGLQRRADRGAARAVLRAAASAARAVAADSPRRRVLHRDGRHHRAQRKPALLHPEPRPHPHARRSISSATRRATTPRWPTRRRTGPGTRSASPAT